MSPNDNSKKLSDSTDIDLNALINAIKQCLVAKQAVRSTAMEFAIPKSTLHRYVKKVQEEFDDIEVLDDIVLLDFVRRCSQRVPSNQVFLPAQEEDLVTYISKCVSHYYGLSINELRELAYQFAVNLGINYPDNWNDHQMATRDWYRAFMRRHPKLTLRTPEQTSLDRVQAFCKTNVVKFFEQLGALLDEHHISAARIYNMDESGFSTVPTKIGKVIALKGMKRVGKLKGAERGTMITMALTVNANGNSLPPFFLFPKKNMESCFLDNASDGSVGFANGSGWMCQPEFVRYMNHFIRFAHPTPDNPVLLLLNNHGSHLSVEALDMAVNNSVHILSFPPHCSHRLLTLVVSVLGSVMVFYKSQCAAWQKNHANMGLEIRHLAGLICKTLDLALTPKNIKAGFQATGIAPYDPDIFSDSDFVQAVETNEVEAAKENELGVEEQRRIMVLLDPTVGHVEEVHSTPEPSTSSISRSTSRSSLSILDEVDPLQEVTPKKPSNRGRKSMHSSSPEILTSLKMKDTFFES